MPSPARSQRSRYPAPRAAEARARAVVQDAFEAREPVAARRRRSGLRLALGVAGAALIAGVAVASPTSETIRRLVREAVVAPKAPRAAARCGHAASGRREPARPGAARRPERALGGARRRLPHAARALPRRLLVAARPLRRRHGGSPARRARPEGREGALEPHRCGPRARRALVARAVPCRPAAGSRTSREERSGSSPATDRATTSSRAPTTARRPPGVPAIIGGRSPTSIPPGRYGSSRPRRARRSRRPTTAASGRRCSRGRPTAGACSR